MPVGSDDDYSQYLIRETRESEDRFRREYLEQVRFVPLIGAQGWSDDLPMYD
jgi:protein-L-isoaspartate(D-aspartate) O-methyltransferase